MQKDVYEKQHHDEWLVVSQSRCQRMYVRVPAALLVLLIILWSTHHRTASLPMHWEGPQAPLRFTSQGTFQISILEDLHFGENAWTDWGPQQDVKTVRVIDRILNKEFPELVVLNGDLITGENTYAENSTHYVDSIVSPLLARNLTWASTYGNHDSQYNLSRLDIYQREHQWRNSRTQRMVFSKAAGVSNYFLPVYSHDCEKPLRCVPELMLWFFDSRGGFFFQQKDANGNQIGQPDWVDQSVVDWFQDSSARLNRLHSKTIPSLAFVHIPTNASLAFQLAVGVDPHREPGINDDYDLAQQARGWCSDATNNASCIYGGQDLPFMEALATTPGLLAVFSGHDHGDTWCYKWDSLLPGMKVKGNGINLCFGQHSGYGGYGSWTRGSRQINVSLSGIEAFELDTWIRLETGAVVGHVSLNSTYGVDEYPATPDTYS